MEKKPSGFKLCEAFLFRSLCFFVFSVVFPF